MTISDACLKYADEEHYCPHCTEKMSCCTAPPFHIGDGLGWGAEAFFVCLNDECPLYVNGWKHVDEQYGHSASYRYMKIAGEKSGSPMMVAGSEAFKGCVIDTEEIKKQSVRYQREKKDLSSLATCVEQKNLEPVLNLILDELAKLESRLKAVELLPAINDLACVDPIRNHKFVNTEVGQLVNIAVAKILQNNYRKECPYCAELIKSQANICQYCRKEL